jgi:hypothetical protein
MAEIKKQHVAISAVLELTISEEELRALDALAGYGADEFIKAFYKVMGEHYLRPYERGLRTFLNSVRGCASLARDAEECREFMRETNAERLKLARVK